MVKNVDRQSTKQGRTRFEQEVGPVSSLARAVGGQVLERISRNVDQDIVRFRMAVLFMRLNGAPVRADRVPVGFNPTPEPTMNELPPEVLDHQPEQLLGNFLHNGF